MIDQHYYYLLLNKLRDHGIDDTKACSVAKILAKQLPLNMLSFAERSRITSVKTVEHEKIEEAIEILDQMQVAGLIQPRPILVLTHEQFCGLSYTYYDSFYVVMPNSWQTDIYGYTYPTS